MLVEFSNRVRLIKFRSDICEVSFCIHSVIIFRPKSPISMMAQLNIIARQLVSICLKQIFIHVGFDITCIQKTFFLICNFHAQRTIILIIQIRTNILLHNIIKRIIHMDPQTAHFKLIISFQVNNIICILC